MIEAVELPELVRLHNQPDGKDYVVQPCVWTQQKIEAYYQRSSRFNIVPDELTNTLAGFAEFVLGGQAISYEIICLQDRDVVGMMFLTDLVKDYSTGRFSSANWHCELWDAKAGPRQLMLMEAIRHLFVVFGLHRLGCEIPTKFGGAIRVARRLGFKYEGRKREAMRFGGEWYDVIVMSLLAQELS